MKILVAGSSGLIGAALTRQLLHDGHDVIRLVRRAPASANEVRWDPTARNIDAQALTGIHAAIHLGGASIASKRWNDDYKRIIRDSRVVSTSLLAEALAQITPKPAVFLCASALGYYGDRGDETLTEDSPKGSGFLADVTAEWEDACAPASDAGIRVCNLRIGVVLSKQGDMPRQMLLPFKLGLGGKIGSGKQYLSWVHIDDVVAAIIHALETPTLQGPLNLSAPEPVTNAEFTREVARALSRPAFFTVPEFALHIAMGELAQFALASTRLQPRHLLDSGFTFKWQSVQPALRDILR